MIEFVFEKFPVKGKQCGQCEVSYPCLMDEINHNGSYIPDLTGLGAKATPSGFLKDEVRRAQIGARAKLSWATTMI